MDNLPLALAFLDTLEGKEFYSSLDKDSREEVLKHSGEFQSKEEIERYLYHLDQSSSFL